MAAIPIDTDQIVITASRAPIDASQTAASLALVDEKRVARLGEPQIPALLRLTPSVSVTQSGSLGTISEVRIRGAEANHTLLFIDGIRANDPARGDAPRFELLNADLVSRIELVRGPQSALWGSQAIGGVVAVTGNSAAHERSAGMLAEGGSFGFGRASVQGSLQGVSGALAWQRSDGIDIFGGGDRDGFRSLAARLRGAANLSDRLEIGASAFVLSGRSEFDGPNPYTFERSHGLVSKDRMVAGRAWTSFGAEPGPWRAALSVAKLHSRSRNAFEGEEINRTSGARTTFSGQAERRLSTGPINHRLILAADHERESFLADDVVYGGASAQDRERTRSAVTGEWRASLSGLTADLAVRHDAFTRFKDATTLRASLLARVGERVSIAGTYGEGIAQPTFFDLFGFFPGLFSGNPKLRPESSRGFEGSLRFHGARVSAALTAHRQILSDEIVDIFADGSLTTANREERSRRSGIEAEFNWNVSEQLRLTAAYAYLNASQPDGDGSSQIREIRRPEHSGAVAADGQRGRLSYGVSLAFTGARSDVNEQPPFQLVRLSSYLLTGARVGYRLRSGIELFARGSNLLGQRYQDVFGYRTEGRSLHAGIRLGARP